MKEKCATAVIHVETGRVIEFRECKPLDMFDLWPLAYFGKDKTAEVDRPENYLFFRVKQLNDLTKSKDYKEIDLQEGEYTDGYGRKLVVSISGGVTIFPLEEPITLSIPTD